MSTTPVLFSSAVKQATTAAQVKQVDAWLYEVYTKVDASEKKIEEQGKIISAQAAKIEELSAKILELEKANASRQTSMDSANFWSKLPKTASIGISNIVAAEQKNIAKEEKNVLIFGLPRQSDSGGDESAVKRILEKIEVTVATDNIKLTRFKDDKNKKPGPILVELSNVETKNIILRSARKLKNDEELWNIV